jgi:hypothetical protein
MLQPARIALRERAFTQESKMPMEFEDDYETYAGTRLFIKVGRPATNTEAAWETFFGTGAEEITITSVGTYNGRSYTNSTLSVVSSGRSREKKGEFTFGSSDFPVVWLPEEPGQITAAAASEGYGTYGFAVVDQNNGVSYFSAQVSTFQEAGGGNNDARTGTMTLLRQSDTIPAATPVVPVEDTTP